MVIPKNQIGVLSDSDAFHFTDVHDSTEIIIRPFPYDFLVLIGLVLLLPTIAIPHEVSMHQRVLELQALVYAMPYLAVMVLLSLSIARNCQRSPVVRWISGVIAVSAFVVFIQLAPF